MVYNMKERKFSTPIKNHHTSLSTNNNSKSVSSPMKAKTRLKSSNKMSSSSSVNSKESARYEEILKSFTSFNCLPLRKTNKIMEKSVSLDKKLSSLDDVEFVCSVPAKATNQANGHYNIVDIVRVNGFSALPSSRPVSSASSSVTSSSSKIFDEWNIKDLSEKSKSIKRNLEELSSAKTDVKSLAIHNQHQLRFLQKCAPKTEGVTDLVTKLTSTFKSFAPQFISHFIFKPHYKSPPLIEDVPLLVPKIVPIPVPKLPEFTQEMADFIQITLSSSASSKLPCEYVDLYVHDLKSLQGNAWLNDNIVDLYFKLIELRGRAAQQKISCQNTFFFNKLYKEGPEVKAFLRREDFLNYDLILIPINMNHHWRMMIVDIPSKTIDYYDSLGWSLENAQKTVFQFLANRVKTKHGIVWNQDEWSFRQPTDIPNQENSFDCGVFACKYADSLARRVPFNFDQSDMPTLRKLMAYEILSGKLLE